MSIDKIIIQMRQSPNNVNFGDLVRVCTEKFGEPRKGSGSHTKIFKMPWSGDPRINIQETKGKAKAYQVKQVLLAIDKLESK